MFYCELFHKRLYSTAGVVQWVPSMPGSFTAASSTAAVSNARMSQKYRFHRAMHRFFFRARSVRHWFSGALKKHRWRWTS